MPDLSIDDDTFLTPQQKIEAESDTNCERHRIAIFEDFRAGDDDLGETRQAVIGALLRHELEHARQHDALGADRLAIDMVFLDQAIRVRVGGLPGGAELYNLKPIEQDANAASAMYLRERHPDHVESILNGPCAQLARSNTPPESLDTLLSRTVACLFQFRDQCESSSGDIPFWKCLATYDQRAATLWRCMSDVNLGSSMAVSD